MKVLLKTIKRIGFGILILVLLAVLILSAIKIFKDGFDEAVIVLLILFVAYVIGAIFKIDENF